MSSVGPNGSVWFYASDAKKRVPVSWTELQELAASGRLKRGDHVLPAGATAWKEAGAVAGLFDNPPPSATGRPGDEFLSGKDPNEEVGTRTESARPGALTATAARVIVPGYDVLGELGRGGMGVVYKARQVALKRFVALKMILGGDHAGPAARARFKAEAEAVARLQHPNIVQVYAVGEHGGHPFFSLEFVDGGSLADRLSEPVPPRRAAELVETLARAVHYAHQRGVVHRDLKPANVLLTADGTPKVTDFGLAKQLDSATQQTQSGAVLGTPTHMAPEQAAGDGKAVGPAADVYALGVILFQLLCGEPPFVGPVQIVLFNVLHTEPPRPRKLRPDLPRDLEWVCLKCLEKDPARRYASAWQLAEELRRWLNDEHLLVTRPVGPAERFWRWCRRNPALAATAALAAAALVAVSVVTTLFAVSESRNSAALREKTALAERRYRESERRLTLSYLERGLSSCEQGDSPLGLAWLTRALIRAEGGQAEDLARVIRTNLDGWRHHVHPLRACLVHGDEVLDADFSPDGRKLVTGSKDGTARLWDVTTGEPLGEPLGHRGPVWAVRFSPDGRLFLTDSDGVGQLWDADTRQPAGPPLRHGGTILRLGVCFSPDGKRLLTGGGNTARLWDVATGQPLGPPLTHAAPVRGVSFSPDGRKVLTTSEDKTARLWDAMTGTPRGEPLGHNHTVYAAAFSPDGKLVLTGSADKTARLWDGETGRPLGPPLQDGEDQILAVAFSPDGKSAVTGSAGDPGTVRLWDVATRKPLGRPMQHRSTVYAAAFSADGTAVLSCSDDGTARLWDATTGRPVGGPLQHRGFVRFCAFSPDGRTVATASADHTARLWDVGPGAPPGPTLRHDQRVFRAAFGPDGRTVATAGADQTARLWDAATGRPRCPPLRHGGDVRAVAFSPDAKTLITGSADRTLRRWNAATGDALGEPWHYPGSVELVRYSPDGRTILAGCRGQTAHLRDAVTGRELFPPLRHEGQYLSAHNATALSPDGRTILTAGPDKTARLWFVSPSPSPRLVLRPDGGGVADAAFSPDGRTVATVSGDTARLWDATTGEPRGATVSHPGVVYRVMFSPDGRRLLTTGHDSTAQLWDVATGEAVCEPFRHENAVMGAAFRPDGRMVATHSVDGTTRIWDPDTGKALGPPLRHRGPVLSVLFSPDGTRLVSTSSDSTARLWPSPTPLPGEAERLTLWVNVLTGLKLDEQGVPNGMDAVEWRSCRGRLNELGGPP